ncbi:hypothetical protein E2C01_045876 [Portunus trituberculatus]|uniref:Uncharacterized protein n=1 Tax=Portunus trituberculatus TaxID=210409 RepID=A0A5B7G369_PORTR|nr:hypothetical protein [Portunus trituberculatus]
MYLLWWCGVDGVWRGSAVRHKGRAGRRGCRRKLFGEMLAAHTKKSPLLTALKGKDHNARHASPPNNPRLPDPPTRDPAIPSYPGYSLLFFSPSLLPFSLLPFQPTVPFAPSPSLPDPPTPCPGGAARYPGDRDN